MKSEANLVNLAGLIVLMIITLACWMVVSLYGFTLSGDLLRITCALAMWTGLTLAAG